MCKLYKRQKVSIDNIYYLPVCAEIDVLNVWRYCAVDGNTEKCCQVLCKQKMAN